MFLVSILKWWYGEGWLTRIRITKERLASSADFFSVGLLISTLFAPFRQISAGKVNGPINDQIRAFFDRLVSRTVGGCVRLFMIIFGLIAMGVQAVFGVFVLIIWLILPALPVAGLIMAVIGWIPR